ncbi:hypothetical protein, partial [Bradyrhizobium liaoningense]|uniref:hypothetical protein n=1 Tax=Bradyrhizobium liaoningense TaxID=43992 RepID=UPI001BA74555
MLADGIDVASSNNGGLGMAPFCGQLSALNCALFEFDAFLSGKQQRIARLTRIILRAGPGCLDSAPLDLSGFLPGYAERGA